MRQVTAGVIILATTSLIGCATTGPPGVSAPVEEARNQPSRSISMQPSPAVENAADSYTAPVEKNDDASVYALIEPSTVETRPISAIDQLVGEAERKSRTGDMPGAVNALERALRIEPRNPHLWNRLAYIRLKQKRYNLASDLAARSNSYTEKGASIRYDNWRIIAATRRATGDYSGAKEAERRAATLQ